MKVLIVYDSLYGNTEKIAKAIASALASSGDVQAIRASDANPAELASAGLLIIGSPTQGGRPTKAIQDFLNKVTETSLRGINVAAFDTRLSSKFVAIFGYAARRIADNLKEKGGTLVASPEGFFVKGNEGPLKDGELERATSWAREIMENQKGNAA